MTLNDANKVVKKEIMHELCTNDNLKYKIDNYGFKRAIIEKK